MARNATQSGKRIDTESPGFQAMPEWARLLAANWNYPKLRSADDVALWRRQMDRTFGGDRYAPTDDELSAAVLWLTGPESRQAEYPTARELSIAVRVLRKRERPVQDTDTGPDARVAQAKTAMIRTNTFAERWDALCNTCQTDDECRAAEAWAIGKWAQQWVDAVSAIKMGFARDWRAARERLMQAMSARRDTTAATVEEAWIGGR